MTPEQYAAAGYPSIASIGGDQDLHDKLRPWRVIVTASGREIHSDPTESGAREVAECWMTEDDYGPLHVERRET